MMRILIVGRDGKSKSLKDLYLMRCVFCTFETLKPLTVRGQLSRIKQSELQSLVIGRLKGQILSNVSNALLSHPMILSLFY